MSKAARIKRERVGKRPPQRPFHACDITNFDSGSFFHCLVCAASWIRTTVAHTSYVRFMNTERKTAEWVRVNRADRRQSNRDRRARSRRYARDLDRANRYR